MGFALSQPNDYLGGPAMRTDDPHIEREDDLGFPAALLVAVPVGLALWATIIWAIVRFLF
jgi:hypothetical protein